MRTINFIGFLFLLVILFGLYNASEKGPFIFKNNNIKKVKILRDSFEPNDIEINLGDEVIWQSHDYVLRHTVVNDDPLLRNSDVLLKGDEFRIIFDRPGDYIFYSSLYPNFQKGIVRVRSVKSGKKFRKDLRENILSVVLNVYGVFLKIVKKIYKIIKNKLFSYMSFKNIAISGVVLSIAIFIFLLFRKSDSSPMAIEININQ